jgi:hypothetical protein
VAPRVLANEGYVKIFLGPGDSNPGPPTVTPSQAPTDRWTTGCKLHCICNNLHLNWFVRMVGSRPGRGLAPALGRGNIIYDHSIKMMGVQLYACGYGLAQACYYM